MQARKRSDALMREIHIVENRHIKYRWGRPRWSLDDATPDEMRTIWKLAGTDPKKALRNYPMKKN